MKKIGRISFFAMLIFIFGLLSCNLQVDDTFPDTENNQIKITKITLSDKNGSGSGTIIRANTIMLTIEVDNFDNTYTTSFKVSENTGILNVLSPNSAVWTSPYKDDIYHIYVYATDNKNTSTGVCIIDVQNTLPQITNKSVFLTSTSAGNSVTVSASDPDTEPATTLSIIVVPNTGAITPVSQTVSNSGTVTFDWSPTNVAISQTINLSISAVDDNPNTASDTISFYYNKP
ncbi:hypothetical protein J7L48_01625 [bacterium]|nr:hypothetical protein [bacterium]